MIRENPFRSIYDILNSESAMEMKFQFPILIDVELTNHCNLDCLFCPTGTGVASREKGFMDEEIYLKILDELNGKQTALRFSFWGEPTLHPKFIRFINLAKKLGILCHVNTNGMLMNENMCKALLESGLDSLKFSFQGVDTVSYQEMRGGNFDFLISNIMRLHKLRGEKMSPFIHVSTTTTYETEDQRETFRSLLINYCDLVTLGKTKLEHIDIEKSTLPPSRKETLKNLQKKQSFNEVRFRVCPEVFAKMSIGWNGDVSACDLDYDAKMVIGNISEDSLLNIFNSVTALHYRALLREKAFDDIPLCKRCFDIVGLQQNISKS